jgi:hypothetical protein
MRLRREELGMSREFLAGEIEQPIERLISYENGWMRVEPALLLRLSISLKLSLADFFADLDPSSACPEVVKRRLAIGATSHLPVRMPALAFDRGVEEPIIGATLSQARVKAGNTPGVEHVTAPHMHDPIDALALAPDRNGTDEPRQIPGLFLLAIMTMASFAAGLGIMSALCFVVVPIIQDLIHSTFAGH